MNRDMDKQKSKQETIDWVGLLKLIWRKRVSLLKVCGTFFCLGILIALLSPTTYRAESKFIPNSNKESSSGSLGGLAALAGINLGNMTVGLGEIPSELYSTILKSPQFQLDVLNSEITCNDRQITYREYLLNRKKSLLDRVKDRLSRAFISISRTNSDATNVSSVRIFTLSKLEYELIKELSELLNVSVNQQEGYVLLTVEDQNRYIAAQITLLVQEKLQDYIIDYKISHSKNVLDFTEIQMTKIRSQLYGLQDSLARFKQENQMISSPFVENKLMRIQSEYDRVNNIFNELALQNAQAKLQVQKETPVFTILSGVTIPNKPYGKSRMNKVLIWMFLGFVLSLIYILIDEPLSNLRQELAKN